MRKLPAATGPEEKYTEYTLDTTFRFGTLQTESEMPQLALNSEFAIDHLNPCTPQAFLKEVTFRFRSQADLALDWHVSLMSHIFNKKTGNSYEMFIPADYFGSSLGFSMMEVPKDQAGNNARVHAILRGCLPVGLWAKAKRVRRTAEDQEWSYFPLPPLVRDVMADLTRELTEIHYLGPLRSPAKRFYIANLDSTPRMDAAGDFLPYVLRDQGENRILYRRPDGGPRLTRGSLKSALNEWLHYLRTGETFSEVGDENVNEIDFTTTKDVLLEFTLQSFGGESHALADSGFGYSQILPIVVRGLVATLGSTLAIEQPELHLNPALQVRIAEFLASLAACNKTILIETHSEHIVNSLRVMAAEDRTGTLANNCRIFFLDTDLGLPMVRTLEVQPDGTVPSWPRGFMGEALSLSSRLLRAQEYKHHNVNTVD
ncbi:MAG TPA: AAA family ATPase [Terriglobales bacterium]|nr:AAA family ATPase [Terriglobales bacterium]